LRFLIRGRRQFLICLLLSVIVLTVRTSVDLVSMSAGVTQVYCNHLSYHPPPQLTFHSLVSLITTFDISLLDNES